MLSNKKLFLFDIDGTIALDNTLFDGSAALLKHIKSIGGAAYFITNNSTKSNADYVEKFQKYFLQETEESQFVTSGFMTIDYLTNHHKTDKIYALATNSFIDELKKNGLTITTTADPDTNCVVVAFDNELTYEKLEAACELLSTKEIPYYGTNPDLCCPVAFGFVPDCGSICQMIENCTGKKPVYLGKPNAQVVYLCQQLSGFSREETLVVGDRLYTDIACGIKAGVETALVLTGEAKESDLVSTPFPPTYTFENVSALLSALQSSHNTVAVSKEHLI